MRFIERTPEQKNMLKILAVALLATSIYAGTASARGGGPAEPMPGTNFTDMPSYRPKPVEPLRRIKYARKHVRWRQSSPRASLTW